MEVVGCIYQSYACPIHLPALSIEIPFRRARVTQVGRAICVVTLFLIPVPLAMTIKYLLMDVVTN